MSRLNPSFGNFVTDIVTNPTTPSNSNFILARVTHVVRGPYYIGTTTRDPFYLDPTSLGEITYQVISGVQDTSEESGNITARPFFSAFKQYPLEGEIVYVMAGPSAAMNVTRNAIDMFYLPPYNLWNAVNHNAFPNLAEYQTYVEVISRSYANSMRNKQAGNLSTQNISGSAAYPLGPNFPEKGNIKTLRQFTGDVTLEGRWGNSIRLGSTTFGKVRQNYWSEDSEPGNPITIIRNGQGKTTDDIPWFPTVENINTDPSSIYLTQGQKIVIDDIQSGKYPLTSLQVELETTQTTAIPIQQQLTSTDTTSAQEQDTATHNVTSKDITP